MAQRQHNLFTELSEILCKERRAVSNYFHEQFIYILSIEMFLF